MSAHESDPLAHPEVQQATTAGYFAGYVVTLISMLAALILTVQHHMSDLRLLSTISGLALLALIAQGVLFFGLSLSRTQIWKSVSLALTVPLFVLSIGLTVWMFNSLAGRTMMPMPAQMQMSPQMQMAPQMSPEMSQPTLLQ